MNKLSSLLILILFAAGIFGLGLVLRRYPTIAIATAMALGPMVVTFVAAIFALSRRYEP